MKKVGLFILFAILSSMAALPAATGFLGSKKLTSTAPWIKALEKEIKALDTATGGKIGVFVKKRGTEEEMNYQTDRNWYFASTVKVPVAIAVLQNVEEGKLSLDQRLTLKKSDPVDGSGEVQFKPPGSQLSVAYLIEKMLTQSDSTATDMLIRLIGEHDLNTRIRTKMGVEDFEPFTTILRVRLDAFSYLHPNARNLTNQHFIDLKQYKQASAKYHAIAKQMRVPVSKLQEKSIEAAFEKYYETELNSGSLRSFGLLLEKLVDGQLLSKSHTKLVLSHMESMTTGDRRVKAGLPKGIRFAQKTGTQVARICNVGIAFSSSAVNEDVIVTACVEKFDNFNEAEKTLQAVGRAISPLLKAGNNIRPYASATNTTDE